MSLSLIYTRVVPDLESMAQKEFAREIVTIHSA